MYFMITKTSLPTIQIWKFRDDFWEKIIPKLPLTEALFTWLCNCTGVFLQQI